MAQVQANALGVSQSESKWWEACWGKEDARDVIPRPTSACLSERRPETRDGEILMDLGRGTRHMSK